MRLGTPKALGVAALTLALGVVAIAPAGAHDVVNAPANVVDVRQALPAGVVARVGAVPLTQDHFEHWRPIVAATSGWSVRDVRERVLLRREVMQFLLLEIQVRLEAAEHRVRVTDAEAARWFAVVKRESFSSDREFRAYLRKSKMTEADARFHIRFDQLHKAQRSRRQPGANRGRPAAPRQTLRP